ncbi:DnaB-like helicase C-terminal domain-containing protein [Bacillus inaquosorum]|uniref:DnaB-like helicase C-terminal domain-containing protein n=1 Tax=Bacteria TaxID=2 RepID=UPI000A10DAD9|nr:MULTISPECIES: DnaB-like helicase C-terminal domain-containing protein [Bacillus subtilis group]MEC2266439.1 DnaB-like helicase C-terminal domain-containing protein [Bacillus subtilis]MEC4031996.1 DnaB-like helicase C-terminal domain-containing protein [Bacillus subtilis]MUG00821.1 DNA helicase [Bacillus tequilensis]WNW25119.1 DnaB-like helicase C-terminal domain-containing protein [Bacillus inaquosorum]
MPSIEELQLLNYSLETKDWDVVDRNGFSEEHFPVHKDAFNFINGFKKSNGQLPTLETVMNKFEEFEPVEIEKIDVVVDSLKEDWLHRQYKPVLKKSAELVAEKKTVDALQEMKIQATNLLKLVGSQGKGYSYIGMADQRKEKYLSIHGRNEDEILGYTTGFAPLDLATNGMVSGGEETDYFLVFAPSNMGKTLMTSFMLQSQWNSSLDWDYPAYFALEQRAEEIARNWDNVLAGVSNLAMQRGTMSEEQKDKYIDFLDRLKQKQKDMVVYDVQSNGGRPYTVAEIQRILESEGHNRFVLDQLSKVRLNNSFGGGDLRQRLFDVSAEVREMILGTGIPGYIVAQANRDSAKRVKKSLENSEVQGEDVGETYAIFQDASKGISIIKINDNTFKVQVIKNRGNASNQSFLVRYNFDTGLVNVLNGEIGEQFF